MKPILVSLIMALMAITVQAETVDIKGVDSGGDTESSTTIEIKKGKGGKSATEDRWEVTDGNGDIEGEIGATEKDARANWKLACQDWKKEVRDDNKENKVINLNCGSISCSGQAGKMICASKATYKIKTHVMN